MSARLGKHLPGRITTSRNETVMAITLFQNDAGFAERFEEFLNSKREVSADVDSAVRDIIADVRQRGDAALIDYTARFDKADLAELGIAVSAEDIASAKASVDAVTMDALVLARDRIRSHHQRQMPKDDHYTDAIGVELGSRWTAVEAVGLYVPGGTASYPSSVLMNAVPAHVAGVERIVMVVPSPGGRINPLVLAAAELAGVSEIYRIGCCGARLRYRDDRAGCQDRRAGQCLCGGCQASGLWQGRNRHDRRPLGGPGHCRQAKRSRLDRGRSFGAGRA